MTMTHPKWIPSVYPGGIENLGDDQLVRAVRAGDTNAFGELYVRYARKAHHAALHLVDSHDGNEDSEDLTAEAFAALLEQLLTGNGPVLRFWPGLLAQLRAAMLRTVTHSDIPLTGQEGIAGGCLSDAQLESARREREYTLVLDAFASLPTRPRTLLLRLVIRGSSVEVVAAALRTDVDLAAKAASTATEALRVAYLQAHVPSSLSPACAEPASRLAAWLCGHLARQPCEQVSRHVADCSFCRQATSELTDLRQRMRTRRPRR
jgi:DNA-directed RNA polymerase specialized sigma24 family protein